MAKEMYKNHNNNKCSASTLRTLLEAEEPFVTVKKLTEIASECEVNYEEIVGFINGCRLHHDEIRHCLYSIAQKYRPDVLKVLDKSKLALSN